MQGMFKKMKSVKSLPIKISMLLLAVCMCFCACSNDSSTSDLSTTSSEVSSNIISSEVSSVEESSSEESSSTPSQESSSKKEVEYSGEKVCYLTFDDGPSALTPKFLEVFEEYDVKVTYFVMGTSHIDYVKDIHEAGHTVALHTDTHQWSIYKSEDSYYNDLNSISKKVFDLTGVESKVIRFPGGSSNVKSRKYCKGIMSLLTKSVEEKGYAYFDWNVDSGDANGNNVPASKIISQIKSQSANKKSVCVLMHDTGAKQTTLDALPEIIEYYKSEGFVFKTLTTDSPIFHHQVNN